MHARFEAFSSVDFSLRDFRFFATKPAQTKSTLTERLPEFVVTHSRIRTILEMIKSSTRSSRCRFR